MGFQKGNQYWKLAAKRGRQGEYRGVTVLKNCFPSKPFWTYIPKSKITQNKNYFIGYFADYHEAAKAYNREVIRLNPNAELNIIDQSIQVPNRYLERINRPYIRSMGNRPINETIALIRANTDDKNKTDNKHLIMFLSGRKDGLGAIVKKYYWYWVVALRKKTIEYKQHWLKKNKKYPVFYYTEEDIVNEGIGVLSSAIQRGKFDGRKFKQWSMQVMRRQMIIMFRKEIKRRHDKLFIKKFDYEAVWAQM